MAKKSVCPICGNDTSKYMGNYRKDGLCRKHASDLKKGKLIFSVDSGEYLFVEDIKERRGYRTKLPLEGYYECVICGQKTNGYAFCRECYKTHTEEEMLDILNNKERESDGGQMENSNDTETNSVWEDNNSITISNDNKCLICGQPTNGVLFCDTCYQKYENKTLLFKLTNCSKVKLLNEDYEGTYTCKDGHIVESKSEREIDNYLFDHGITHAYGKELPYGPNEMDVLRPKFCLIDYLGKGKHVYIEHWGYDDNNLHYSQTRTIKMPIYKILGITLVNIYEKTDMSKLEVVLDRKLNKNYIRENKINFEENN